MNYKDLTVFKTYVRGFYGKGGIYEFNAPKGAIDTACEMVSKRADIPFEGDSVDRERVRDILERLGYSERGLNNE